MTKGLKKNSKEFSDIHMLNLKTTLTKMIAHLDTDPDVKRSFSLIWVLQNQISHYYIYNTDLDLDDCMDLYYAYKKSQRLMGDKEQQASVYKQIIDKIIKEFEQMFEEGCPKSEIKYLIKNKLPDLTDNIDGDQLEAFIGMIEDCK